MPPLPAVPTVVKIQLLYDNSPIGGVISQAANILHVSYNTTPPATGANLITVANGAMTWWGTHFKASITSYWRLKGAIATTLDGTGTQGASTSAAISGTATPPALPPQTAVCISWLGAPAVRGGRPRTYLPGIPTSANTPGTSDVLSGYATTLRTAAVAALADMTWATIGSNNGLLAGVSYYWTPPGGSPGTLRSPPLVYDFTGARVHERLDSQRRRSGRESTFPFT